MSTSIPPFYVGQEVVAIRDHSALYFKKGDVFTVLATQKHCCDLWDIDVGILNPYGMCRCGICSRLHHSDVGWVAAKSFAPVEKFKAVSFTKIMEDIEISVN